MAYVPRLLPRWAAADPEPAHRVVDGSLVFFDITGFTPLTERLARKGREGAEELSNLLDTVFGRLLMGAEDDGGDLLKWGGDALFFSSTVRIMPAELRVRRSACSALLPRWDAPRLPSAGSCCTHPLLSNLVRSISSSAVIQPCTASW